MSATHSSPQLLLPAAVASASSWQPPAALHHDQTVYARGDDTLARITGYANDVEMQEPASAGSARYLVLDTNVLIDNLKVIRTFSEDVDRATLPWTFKIIVPSVTISELDGLKNREGISWFARTASTVLLEKVKEKTSIRVQARYETLDTKPLRHERSRTEDISIWDCCQYFRSLPDAQVVLMSNDKNLCILHQNDEPVIPTMSPGKRAWSSHDLAALLFGNEVDLTQFRASDHMPKYRPTRSRSSKHLAQTDAPRADEDDSMDVDDDSSIIVESWVPSHALDGLHLQIIDHFSIVLKELTGRVRHEMGEAGPPAQSRHAPAHRRKPLLEWTVRDCLEYLGTKRTLGETQPPLETFLLRRNEDRGWRRGQDWPRQAWENCVDALENIGRVFQDAVVLISVQELRLHVKDVFGKALRPTGT